MGWDSGVCCRSRPARSPGFAGFVTSTMHPRSSCCTACCPDYWGQGLATEAARAALAYGFDAALFTRVYVRTDAPNRASVRVMERLGMKFERETRLAARPTLIYSLTRRPRRSITCADDARCPAEIPAPG